MLLLLLPLSLINRHLLRISSWKKKSFWYSAFLFFFFFPAHLQTSFLPVHRKYLVDYHLGKSVPMTLSLLIVRRVERMGMLQWSGAYLTMLVVLFFLTVEKYPMCTTILTVD